MLPLLCSSGVLGGPVVMGTNHRAVSERCAKADYPTIGKGVVRLPQYRFSLRWLFIATGLVALFAGTNGFGLVEFRYPATDNDPLYAPIRVLAINGNVLTLEDGRRIRVESFDWVSLPIAIEASNYRIDLKPIHDERMGVIGSTKCDPHRHRRRKPLLYIPLVPQKANANCRKAIGFARELP